MKAKKYLLILGFIFILLLASCSQQTVKYQCSDGSFVDSSDLCSGEAKQVVVQKVSTGDGKLLTKPVSQMALLSSDMEAGYVLKREDSGIFEPSKERAFEDLSLADLSESFKLSFEKQVEEFSEGRLLHLFLFKFNEVSSAGTAYDGLVESMESSEWYKEVSFSNNQADGFKVYKKIYTQEYEYDFYEWVWYAVNLRIKNVVVRMYIGGKSTKVTDAEIEVYINKLINRITDTKKIIEEVSSTQQSKVYSTEPKLEIKIGKTSRNIGFEKAEHYSYATVPSLHGTGKMFLFIPLIIKNIGVSKGFSATYDNFVVIDEKGTRYHPPYDNNYLEGYWEDLVVKLGQTSGQRVVVPIFERSKEFTLEAYDDYGNQVAEVEFE